MNNKNNSSPVTHTIKSIVHGGIYGFVVTGVAAFIGIPPGISARIGNLVAVAFTAEQITQCKPTKSEEKQETCNSEKDNKENNDEK